MRVTPGVISAQIANALARAQEGLARQQAMISSGKRITTPSDDPGGASRALTVRSRGQAVDQFRRNLLEAKSSLGGADGALRSVLETLTRAREAAIQGSNDTLNATDRRALGEQVNQYLEELVSLANTRGGRGQYLFGGQETTTSPYAVTRDASGKISAVTPNARGIDGATPVEVNEDLVSIAVGGTSVFGASTDTTFAFDVLIRLRDRLDQNNAVQNLTFVADVAATGAATASAFLGFDTATDFQIAGPSGTTFAPLTAAGSDTVSAVGAATSAIAAAAAVNAVSATTGVSATATAARITYTAGAFSANVTLDGTAGKTLVVNGVSVTGAVTGATATARRDALVTLINAQVGGVVATAVGVGDFTLTAADGRNISIRTDNTTGAGSANAELFGFTTGLTTERVVARGGVTMSAATTFTTTESNTPANQIGGEGTAQDVRTTLDEVTTASERATLASTVVGSRAAWLDVLDERLQDQGLALATELSHVEDLDFARAVQDLQALQTSYEASVASAARILQVSLLDFLR
jgi:flagellar hook-associated protein 3 FlgL